MDQVELSPGVADATLTMGRDQPAQTAGVNGLVVRALATGRRSRAEVSAYLAPATYTMDDVPDIVEEMCFMARVAWAEDGLLPSQGLAMPAAGSGGHPGNRTTGDADRTASPSPPAARAAQASSET